MISAIFAITSKSMENTEKNSAKNKKIQSSTDEFVFLAGALVHIGSHLPFAVYGICDKGMYRAICRLLCHKRLLEPIKTSRVSVIHVPQ